MRRIIPKRWGWEDWIVNKPEYCGKVLFVKKGHKCSWHYHKLKDETFYLQGGRLVVRWYDAGTDPDEEVGRAPAKWNFMILTPGDSFHVPVGRRHQFEAIEDTTLIEFSTQHFDDDSYRIVTE